MIDNFSFFKYPGSKKGSLVTLDEYLPPEFNDYYEPFVGSGALALSTYIGNKRISINDINDNIISNYINISKSYKTIVHYLKKRENKFKSADFIPYIKTFKNSNTFKRFKKKYEFEPRPIKPTDNDNSDEYNIKISERELIYYLTRKEFNKLISENSKSFKHTILFLFLNRTCFNGVYRESHNGRYNVPFNKEDWTKEDFDNDIVREDLLSKASQMIQKFKIYNKDYKYIFAKAKKNDFLYIDPPYSPISETSKFTEYTKGGFDDKYQRELYHEIVKLHKKGCKFLLSNSNNKFIKKLYRSDKSIKFHIKPVTMGRSIQNWNSNKKENETKLNNENNEVLIFNYSESRGPKQKELPYK